MEVPLLQLDGLCVPPDRWQLKGEGAANWVFGLRSAEGEDRKYGQLAGKVLRVRKPRPAHCTRQADLEEAVWAPVLGAAWSGADAASAPTSADMPPHSAAAREQRYMQRVLAPLLGQQHVPEVQLVALPAAYLEQVLAANRLLQPSGSSGGGSAVNAFVTGELPASPSLHVADGETVAAALLPDVTLLPPAGSCSARSGGDGCSGAATCPCKVRGDTADAGPVVCLELKPKCGFVGSCGTVHPSNRHIKRARSRYQLHQLLKLSQGKIAACSRYDPCDLFSGQPARVRLALRALLEHPQNNLRLFADGQPAELPALGSWQQGQQAHEDDNEAAEEVQQRDLEREGDEGQQQVYTSPQRQRQDVYQQQHTSRDQEGSGASSAALTSLLVDLPASQRLQCLVELVAAALKAEGVLQRLLRAQQQCPYDVEGVYRLYCQLTGQASAADAVASALPDVAGAAAAAPAAETQAQVRNCSNGEAQSTTAGSGGSPTDGAPVGDAACDDHSAALKRLLALPTPEAHAVLRSYAVSATAKDCAVMVALQRRTPAETDDSGSGSGSDEEGSSGSGSDSSAGGWRATRHHAVALRRQRGTRPGMLRLQPSGACFRYCVHFVDLDMKPLAKIPAHHDLDQRIVEAARAHLGSSNGAGQSIPASSSASGGAGGRQPVPRQLERRT